MPMLLTLLGVAVVAIVMLDVTRVTLAVDHRDRMIGLRVSDYLWAVVDRVMRGRRPVRGLGVAVEVGTVTSWFLFVWAGWSLVFLGAPDAVVSSETSQSAGGWDRVYFAGITLFTLGNGEFRPQGAGWQLAATAAVLNGLTLVTLAVTGLLEVLQAVVEKRQLASTIAALGTRPEELVLDAAQSGSWAGLEQHLVALTPRVNLLAQQHLAYPVLHFFRSDGTQEAAIAPALALLDDALLILAHAFPPCTGPNRMTVKPLRTAIRHFLSTLDNYSIEAVTAPPPPDLEPLRRQGLELVSDEEFHKAVTEEEPHRCLLHGLVHVDGWEWATLWR